MYEDDEDMLYRLMNEEDPFYMGEDEEEDQILEDDTEDPVVYKPHTIVSVPRKKCCKKAKKNRLGKNDNVFSNAFRKRWCEKSLLEKLIYGAYLLIFWSVILLMILLFSL